MMIHLRFLVVRIIVENDKMVATDSIEVVRLLIALNIVSDRLQLNLTQKATRNYEFWLSFPRIFEYGYISPYAPARYPAKKLSYPIYDS